MRQDVAARDVDVVREGERHRVSGPGFVQVPVRRHDPRDRGQLSGGRDRDAVAGANRARHDRTGEPAEIEVRPVDPLHRESKGLLLERARWLQRLQALEQRRTLVPGQAVRPDRDVVPEAGGQGDGRDRGEGERPGEALVVVDDVTEALAGEADEVHLVHGQDDVLDAEQRADVAVAPCLREDALAGVEENHRRVRGGSARRHVARVLLVPGRVGDDEGAALGAEEAVGDVDGDALLALGLEPVDQEGEIEVAAGRAVLAAVTLEGRELVVRDEMGVEEQTPDQGGLAVVD